MYECRPVARPGSALAKSNFPSVPAGGAVPSAPTARSMTTRSLTIGTRRCEDTATLPDLEKIFGNRTSTAKEAGQKAKSA